MRERHNGAPIFFTLQLTPLATDRKRRTSFVKEQLKMQSTKDRLIVYLRKVNRRIKRLQEIRGNYLESNNTPNIRILAFIDKRIAENVKKKALAEEAMRLINDNH